MSLDLDTRCSGHWITAQQGMGKTTLLLSMIASDIQKDASVIVLDPKGDLSGPVRKCALGDRLVVLDPLAQTPFAINPLDVPKTDVRRAVDVLEYIFGVLLEAGVTPKQKALLRSILRAIVIGFPDPTLRTIQDIITVGPRKYQTHIDKLPADLQEFFNQEWKDYDSTRSELKWRMRLLLENDLIQRMFSAPRNRFRIAESMDRGDVVVIDNSIEHLHKDGSTFLGRFFLAQIWAAAMARSSRPREQKKPVFVYIDEADIIIDATVAAIIDRCRSQNIALILSIQRSKQIEDANVLSALENCAIKMANVDAEASYFSKLLHIEVERINQLPRGHFATHIRGQGGFISTVEKTELPYRNMTEAEEKAHRQRMIDLYGYKPETHKPPQGEGKPVNTQNDVKPIVAQPKKDPSAPSRW